MTIYSDILHAIKSKKKLLAVLIDPDKMMLTQVKGFINKLHNSIATHIFVGGSEVEIEATEKLVAKIKAYTKLPVVLFPGDVSQITEKADALLYLSLISGRNPEYLIGKHVESANRLKKTNLEIIPTGYILIENGKETAVQRVTNTQPIPRNNEDEVTNTAFAGQLLGKQLIYLEAGSGATHPVPLQIIKEVKKAISIPLIVGGGVRTKEQLKQAYQSGADLVVIGTAFEEDINFFNEIKQ